LRVAASAVRHGVPITPRGSGNYGQAVPLAGGIVLDMSALQAIEWQRSGIVRAAAGAKMHDIDVRVRPSDSKLRMHPSTKRTATIGGFVAGGSGGIQPGVQYLALYPITVADEARPKAFAARLRPGDCAILDRDRRPC
jgi:FAD/FMN-containing dehydrogenase